MKNIITKRVFTLSLVVLIGLSSCTKELLDQKPISSLPAEGFYETISDARAGMNGVYNAVQSTFRINFAFWGEGRADNVKTRHSGEELNLIQNNLNDAMSSASWSNLYTVISRANYAIKYIPEIKGDGDGDYAKQLIGQARALRAISYFYLVRVWGDVPLILDPYISKDQDFFVDKTDSETVLDQIETDLQYAAEHCVDKFNNDNDRIMITRGSANAFLTEVYIWRHKYDKALESSEEVMKNDLYALVPSVADWSQIFTSGYSKESIFEVGYEEGQATNSLRVLYAIGSDAIYTPSDKFIASTETGDRRIPYVYDITEDDPRAIWKFLGRGVSDEDPSASDQNIVLIRLADVMLLRAEALAATGGAENITEALDLLNQIRRRAGLVSFNSEAEAAAMYGSLEDAILHERSIELCFEGHRWFDLVRTGKAISTMNPLNGLSDEGNLVWPISKGSLDKNPTLNQNDFYR